MAEDRALVRNATSGKQLAAAERAEKKRRERLVADTRAVLSSPEGRRFIWHLMGHCRTFGSTFDEQTLRIAYNAGRQDVGHYLQAMVADTDEDKLLVMMQEARAAERFENNTIDATHSEAAGNGKARTQETETDA